MFVSLAVSFSTPPGLSFPCHLLWLQFPHASDGHARQMKGIPCRRAVRCRDAVGSAANAKIEISWIPCNQTLVADTVI